MKHLHFLYFYITLIIHLVCNRNCVKSFEILWRLSKWGNCHIVWKVNVLESCLAGVRFDCGSVCQKSLQGWRKVMFSDAPNAAKPQRLPPSENMPPPEKNARGSTQGLKSGFLTRHTTRSRLIWTEEHRSRPLLRWLTAVYPVDKTWSLLRCCCSTKSSDLILV